MVAIVSIRMGDMIGHGSWPMSWIAALQGYAVCHINTYLGRYLHTRLKRQLSILSFLRGMDDYVLISTWAENWQESDP